MKYLLGSCLLALLLGVGCGPKKGGATHEASLEELNRAASVVAMRTGGFPPSTNELAAFLAGSGKTLPTPPPGKKLAFDPAKRQFVLMDQ